MQITIEDFHEAWVKQVARATKAEDRIRELEKENNALKVQIKKLEELTKTKTAVGV
jgi:cell division protein FtsB